MGALGLISTLRETSVNAVQNRCEYDALVSNSCDRILLEVEQGAIPEGETVERLRSGTPSNDYHRRHLNREPYKSSDAFDDFDESANVGPTVCNLSTELILPLSELATRSQLQESMFILSESSRTPKYTGAGPSSVFTGME